LGSIGIGPRKMRISWAFARFRLKMPGGFRTGSNQRKRLLHAATGTGD
jgi:hypothetical protein